MSETKIKKDKKYKGGPKRKSYIKSIAAKGGGSHPKGEYIDRGDYNKGEVYDQATTLIPNPKGKPITIHRKKFITPADYAKRLINAGILKANKPFRWNDGKVYTAKADTKYAPGFKYDSEGLKT
jgi:hypothetical protein